MYLLEDTPANRRLIHRYIDIYEYPDGKIELRTDGTCIGHRRYGKLQQVHTAAIVENKRLNHALQAALLIQAQRDDRRSSNTPSRANQVKPPAHTKVLPGRKRSRAFTAEDVELAVLAASPHLHAPPFPSR